ncbi:MAG: DUF1894 domain-containing protein [Methanosarcinales archaeon]
MTCINDLQYEILLAQKSIKECIDYIKKNIKEIYYVEPGYKVKGLILIGSSQIPIGINGNSIIFPFIKPCMGAYVLKIISASDEIKKLKNSRCA